MLLIIFCRIHVISYRAWHLIMYNMHGSLTITCLLVYDLCLFLKLLMILLPAFAIVSYNYTVVDCFLIDRMLQQYLSVFSLQYIIK